MEADKKVKIEEQPPIFGSWNKWYSFVTGFLVFLIIVFYLFTRFFE